VGGLKSKSAVHRCGFGRCALLRQRGLRCVQVHIHKSLKHENVVALLTHHLIDRSIAVVLEFCDNGSLRQLLAKTAGGLLTEPVTRRYFLQVGIVKPRVQSIAAGLHQILRMLPVVASFRVCVFT